MPNYKELYFKMFHASEQAINILITAQRECEDLYVSCPKPTLRVLEHICTDNKSVDEQ